MRRFRPEIGERRSRVAAWLVITAILLRALIPVGYMINLEAGATGEPLLVLCPTGLSESAQAHLGDGHPAPSGHQAHDAPCVFAAVAALAAALAGLGLALALFEQLRGWPLPRDAHLRHAGLASANGARAPPLSA